jgi:hypothetical protein
VYIYLNKNSPKLKGTDERNFVESIQTNIGWLDVEVTEQELARKIYASMQSAKVNQGPGRATLSKKNGIW